MRINLRKLTALTAIIPKKDPRHYLKGVQVKFDCESDGFNLTATATNGYSLGQFKSFAQDHDTGEAYQGESFEIIIPAETLAGVKLKKSACDYADLRENGDRWEIVTDTTTTTFTPVEGVFPDCSRVIPSGSASGEIAQFDIDILASFSKIAKSLGAKRPGCFVIEHNGLNGTRLTHSEVNNFLGVIMPFREE